MSSERAVNNRLSVLDYQQQQQKQGHIFLVATDTEVYFHRDSLHDHFKNWRKKMQTNSSGRIMTQNDAKMTQVDVKIDAK